MDLVIEIIIGIFLFILSIYFTRWVFGIDKIIENQREQSKLLKSISDNINNLTNEKINAIDNSPNTKVSKIMDNENNCPACNSVLKNGDIKCPNCGLVVG